MTLRVSVMLSLCWNEFSETKTAEAIEKKSQTLPQYSIIDLCCNYLPPWQNKTKVPSHVATAA